MSLDGDTIILNGCKSYTKAELNFDAIDIFFLNNPSFLQDSSPFEVRFYTVDGVNEYLTAVDTKSAYVKSE